MTEYSCKITDEREDDEAFLVALLEVPDFPDDRKINDIVRIPMRAVIAAGYDDNGLRFADVNKDGFVDIIRAKGGSQTVFINNKYTYS